MYTTSTIPIDVQNKIIENANATVKTYAFAKYPHLFTEDDIKDIAGTVCLKACRSIACYDSQWKLSTWVATIAKNCVKTAVDYKMKRLPISQEMFMDNEDGEEMCFTEFSSYRGDEFEADRELLMNEFFEQVDEKTKGLSEKDKQCLEWMEDGLAPREMAKIAGCNANSAAIRSCNVRKMLKEPLTHVAEEFGVTCKKLAA